MARAVSEIISNKIWHIKEAVEARSPIWLLRKTISYYPRSPRSEEVGVWGTRKGQDTLGRRPFQAGCVVS